MQFQNLTQHMEEVKVVKPIYLFVSTAYTHCLKNNPVRKLWLSPFYGWKDWGTKEIRTLLVVASSIVWIAASVYLKGKWDPHLSPLPFPNPDTQMTHDVKHAHSQKQARKMLSAYRRGKKERRAAPLATSPIPFLIWYRAGGRGLSLCGLGGNKPHCFNKLQMPY